MKLPFPDPKPLSSLFDVDEETQEFTFSGFDRGDRRAITGNTPPDLLLKFPYDEQLVQEIKQIGPPRAWFCETVVIPHRNETHEKVWILPVNRNNVLEVRAFLDRFDFKFRADVTAMLRRAWEAL